jgi:hypothetical protein
VKTALALGLIFAAQTCSAGIPAESSNFVGRWKVEVTFKDTSDYLFRFDARGSGKGSLLLQEPRSSLVESAEPSAAVWTLGEEKEVTFSAPVEFPIGNVGRDQGTLVFKGTFKTDNLMSGEVSFIRLGQDPKDPKATPSRTGTFKATRIAANDASR